MYCSISDIAKSLSVETFLQYVLQSAVFILYTRSYLPACTKSKRVKEGERKEVTDGRLGVSLYMWMAVSNRQMQGRNTQKQQAGGEQK